MEEAKRILEKTDGGLAVFKHYMGDICVSKTFRNPYREDNRPSCRLYLNKPSGDVGYYYLQDYGDSRFCGNCFTIVARILGYSLKNEFRRLLEQIDRDMGLSVFSSCDKAFQGRQTALKKIKSHERKYTGSGINEFVPIVKAFSEKELAFWSRYGIQEDTLGKYHVKSLQSCDFKKTDGKSFCIVSSPLIPVFGYYFSAGHGIKLYRPTSDNRFLYAGKLPKPYIFGWEELPSKGKDVFITGGEKDVLSLAAHGFHAIAFNSETAKIPESVMDDLSRRFKRIIFLYDTDSTGIQESANRVMELENRYNVHRLLLPLPGTKQKKDISDYFALGNHSTDFENLIKESL